MELAHEKDYKFGDLWVRVWSLYNNNDHKWELAGVEGICKVCGSRVKYFYTYMYWAVQNTETYKTSCSAVQMDEALG